ncbi:branched-chain amino acid aminotransferase [Bacillus massiliglaciei]|uniref:branched-chain amino acid aminotransferase n=1 Tax=Bacillus massiliglaciei TaxID=1816693 RepID=UPI000DA6004A|nr:branched-chain amino acid aminotransferase [Bacillus massiliglaciei]
MSLIEKLKQYSNEQEWSSIDWFKEEQEWARENGLSVTSESESKEKTLNRFKDTYIEIGDKESEDTIMQKNHAFLDEPVTYIKQNKDHFLYLESNWFAWLGIEGAVLEYDDVFGTYSILFGLKIPKKLTGALKEKLISLLEDGAQVSAVFDSGEGVWNVNFPLEHIPAFSENMTLLEVYVLAYRILFNAVSSSEPIKRQTDSI